MFNLVRLLAPPTSTVFSKKIKNFQQNYTIQFDFLIIISRKDWFVCRKILLIKCTIEHVKDDQHLIHLLIMSSLIISLTSQRPNLVNTSPSNRSRGGFYQKPNKYMNKSIHRQPQGIGLMVLVCDLGILLSPKFSGCMAGMDRPIWIGKSLGDKKFNICERENLINVRLEGSWEERSGHGGETEAMIGSTAIKAPSQRSGGGEFSDRSWKSRREKGGFLGLVHLLPGFLLSVSFFLIRDFSVVSQGTSLSRLFFGFDHTFLLQKTAVFGSRLCFR